MSYPNDMHRASGDGREYSQDLRHERHEMEQPIRWCEQQDHSEWQPRDTLLIRQPAVHSQEDFEFTAGALEEFTISLTGPSPPCHGLDRVSNEQSPEIVREILVKKDVHRPRPNHGRVREPQSPARG